MMTSLQPRAAHAPVLITVRLLEQAIACGAPMAGRPTAAAAPALPALLACLASTRVAAAVWAPSPLSPGRHHACSVAWDPSQLSAFSTLPTGALASSAPLDEPQSTCRSLNARLAITASTCSHRARHNVSSIDKSRTANYFHVC